MYSHDLSGLTTCFVAALPFFAGTLLGDIAWTVILSVAYPPIAARPGRVSVPTTQISAL
jgi:hypothetical protein